MSFEVGDLVTISDNEYVAPGFRHLRGTPLVVIQNAGYYKVIDPETDTILYPHGFELKEYAEPEETQEQLELEFLRLRVAALNDAVKLGERVAKDVDERYCNMIVYALFLATLTTLREKGYLK